MTWICDGASGATPERWARIHAEAARSRFGNVVNFPYPHVGDVLDIPDLGDEFRRPLVSDVRTLFLTGTLDWNTPPYQAEEVRWGFTNATHIIVENAGHEQILPLPEIQAAGARFLRGEDVRDVHVELPPLRFVPIRTDGATATGSAGTPAPTHPSVPSGLRDRRDPPRHTHHHPPPPWNRPVGGSVSRFPRIVGPVLSPLDSVGAAGRFGGTAGRLRWRGQSSPWRG